MLGMKHLYKFNIMMNINKKKQGKGSCCGRDIVVKIKVFERNTSDIVLIIKYWLKFYNI